MMRTSAAARRTGRTIRVAAALIMAALPGQAQVPTREPLPVPPTCRVIRR
jgi:hypothetical protein